MVIEGLLTTTNIDGSMHLAPMGPIVNAELTQWKLRPFKSSHTFQNLSRTGSAIFHVVDDALLLAKGAIGYFSANSPTGSDPDQRRLPSHEAGKHGWILSDACHWYALSVTQWDTSAERATAEAISLASAVVRPFWGWNRAKHAVLEAAILATRTHILSREEISSELLKLKIPIDKTAGDHEREAFQLIADYIDSKFSTQVEM